MKIKRTILIIIFDSPHIDRRTLLFAKALMGAGYAVRIMAPCAVSEPGFEDVEITNVCPEAQKSEAYTASKDIFKKHAPQWLFDFAKKFYKRYTAGSEFIPYYGRFVEAASGFRADIYLACDLPTLPVAAEARKKNGGLLVYDAHEFYTGQITLRSEERKYLEKIERGLVDSVDLFITVNEDIAGVFRKEYGARDIKIILNATNAGCGEKRFLHDVIGIPRDERIALFQGGFSPNRNLEKLIDMAARLKKSTLVMLGWGDLEGELRKKAQALGILGARLHFVPKIPQSELLSYTSSATIGLIPYPAVDINTKFCTPNKLFEFVRAGLPILANSELVTVGGFIKKYSMGFTADFNDPAAAAEKIDSVISDERALSCARAGIEKATDALSWESEAKRLIAMIDGISRK